MRLHDLDVELMRDYLVKLDNGDLTIDETLSSIVNIANFRLEVFGDMHAAQLKYLTEPKPVIPLPDFRVGNPAPAWGEYTETDAWRDELAQADRLKRAADNS